MTGFYVRIKRDGKWQSIEIENLTDDELESFANNQGVSRGWVWVRALCEWINKHVTEK